MLGGVFRQNMPIMNSAVLTKTQNKASMNKSFTSLDNFSIKFPPFAYDSNIAWNVYKVSLLISIM